MELATQEADTSFSIANNLLTFRERNLIVTQEGEKFMVKQTFIMASTFGLLLGLSQPALSGAHPDTGPGCGLGNVAWEGQDIDKRAIGPQLLMSTTNNPIFPLQAFSITSGNFGCQNNRKVWAHEKSTMFSSINFDTLSQELAQGGGEYLVSLTTLMGIPKNRHETFLQEAQSKYIQYLTAGETPQASVIAALNDSIPTHPQLAQNFQ